LKEVKEITFPNNHSTTPVVAIDISTTVHPFELRKCFCVSDTATSCLVMASFLMMVGS